MENAKPPEMLPTTHPAPPHTPRDDLSLFSSEELALIHDTKRRVDWGECPITMVAAYLKHFDWDEEEVISKIKSVRVEFEKRDKPSLMHILPFVGADPQGVPRPCGVLLEDGRGGCARDLQGNPIVVVYGAFECDSEGAILQMNFLNDRLVKYIGEKELPMITYVFDMGPRKHLHNLNMPFNMAFYNYTQLFPQTFNMYICAASPLAIKGFNILPSGMKANTVVAEDYSNLVGKIAPESMLPGWHEEGKFDFDISKYMQFLLESM